MVRRLVIVWQRNLRRMQGNSHTLEEPNNILVRRNNLIDLHSPADLGTRCWCSNWVPFKAGSGTKIHPWLVEWKMQLFECGQTGPYSDETIGKETKRKKENKRKERKRKEKKGKEREKIWRKVRTTYRSKSRIGDFDR